MHPPLEILDLENSRIAIPSPSSGEWETTREEAAVAHGDAVRAANYASEDWDRANQLAQIASPGHQAAIQTEQDYAPLEHATRASRKRPGPLEGQTEAQGPACAPAQWPCFRV
jgi:hypothetical protein